MISTVLIVVTLGQAGGPPHVSFANTDDMAACADKAQAITGILQGAGYTVAAHRCAESDFAFTPYDHRATEFPHAYRLTLPAGDTRAAVIDPIAALADCAPAPDADPAVWCAMSSQWAGLP